ncbi:MULTISPECIES: hypothetical protein [unclassified Rhizobium]|uniref:hypothetical protein n=1 Tax=unclassified Rhizobium TaxID=2613769 RepID=UPI00115D980A|nr:MULTISPECIES: hypothetical protein [unclassified Rhizobium]TQX90258.1 hypothetical protein EQW76_11180 [Rhizobium sp. rho-13.1]TQY16208.1 hypothetical protein EQW74_10770 [Rhizobium sp. rho-1.1]
MDKDSFLRLQYLRMINSDEFVVEQWRSSIDRFIADMWERTPTVPGRRFLAPVDPTLGFSPDNVEWQFPRIKSRSKAKIPSKQVVREIAVRLTKAERMVIKQAERELAIEEKRKAIAAELAAWNNGSLTRRG